MSCRFDHVRVSDLRDWRVPRFHTLQLLPETDRSVETAFGAAETYQNLDNC